MQSNRVSIKIFVFCLAFFLGFSISKCFNPNVSKNTLDKIERKEMQKPIVSFDPKEIKHNPVKHQCKKYFDDVKYNELLNEQAKTYGLFIANKNSSQKRKMYRQKIEELESRIEILRKIKVDLKISRREPNAFHNLLYIKNCAEY